MKFFCGGKGDEPVIISQKLLKFNMPFRIDEGIKSLVLQGDEVIDIYGATDLKDIDTSRFSRYILEDNVLYNKGTNGDKGTVAGLLLKGNIDGIRYYNTEFAGAVIFGDDSADPVRIPQDLLLFNERFTVCSGVKSLILQGDEIIDIDDAKDLRTLDIRNSKVYYMKGNLYQRVKYGEYDRVIELRSDIEIID